jgi:hypothetical protein
MASLLLAESSLRLHGNRVDRNVKGKEGRRVYACCCSDSALQSCW